MSINWAQSHTAIKGSAQSPGFLGMPRLRGGLMCEVDTALGPHVLMEVVHSYGTHSPLPS